MKKIPWKNNNLYWGAISIAIHWITAITVIGLFALGLWMTGLSYYDQWYKTAPFIHKSVGILLLFLTIFRVIWRVKNPTPQSLPSHTKWEKKLAHLMHLALYALLFSTITAGYLISTADGRAISVFDWFEVPATITSIPKQEDIAGFVHLYLAWTIIIMVVMHGLAAIKHHIINKDATLKRMIGRN